MKVIKLIVIVAIASIVFCQVQQKQISITDINLSNIEAFARDESGQEKIYSYSISYNEECIVYVGGAYAKGKKVSCWSGNEHPICSDCVIVNP